MTGTFPIPFTSLRIMSGGTTGPYIIGAMFTAAYSKKAERLAASCEKFGLAYEIHEVPTVHRSISIKGSDDLRFTKANFIYHLLKTHKRPVLYIDSDCEIIAQPHLVAELVQSRCDFAIYNFLADDYTDQFRPISFGDDGQAEEPHRYFRYHGSVDLLSKTQLMCVGCSQFYNNSVAARALLSRWHHTVALFPGCADDECLDFTYNNLGRRDWLRWVLRKHWLPKSYARYMFWIYAEPVINHPDVPETVSKFSRIRCPRGRKRFYPSMAEKRNGPLLLPRDCIIDTEERTLCKLIDGKPVAVEKVPFQFWV